ncbi:hypothetical protein L6R49_05065 [Myxococcota bacterium]|nr:hypothetical protein [Myxococcota bacterium]
MKGATFPLLLLLAACVRDDDWRDGGDYIPGGGWPTPEDDTGSTGDDSGGGDSGGDSGGGGDSGDTAFSAEDCGVSVGEVACDLQSSDQLDAAFSLWELYPSPTVIVFGDAYDGNLKQASAWLPDLSGDDVVPIVVLLDNQNLTPATTADAAAWATSYGLPVVLTDPTGDLDEAWAPTTTMTSFVVGPDMVIVGVYYGYLDEGDVRGDLGL